MKTGLFAGGMVLACMAAAQVQAQRVLFRADPATDSMQVDYGPNRQFYQHVFLGYAPVVGRPAGPGADLRYFTSAEPFAGIRYKFRLSKAVSTGFDFRYARLVYALEQNSRKQLPTATLHRKESLVFSQLQLEPFIRLGFGRRGNVVGRYLDVSGWGGWAMATSHHTLDQPGFGGSARTVTIERGLSYVRRWSYGVGSRLGAGRYALVGRYRLSDTFTTSASPAYAELPRWLFGLEMGLF
ncbi:hypothetical protein [Hymenobacter metallilatus]|uniref:Outer membrane protein beta-barrel domain-containing protein n=1 Tax=Hymenobacter metallilatus TaxID=2493666 RepID=A0A428IYE9_9BACT|nr:hypothetical protein [Hymenobacter metallilatus]RSK24068.1 hypothetical protein EI290_20945 [Hymenobacter metallilatus]